VLEGARSVLERKRPVILCEVGSAASADVTAFLAAFGYRILNGELPPAERETLRSAPWCTLAVPS
jgi:hypothetical protein